MYRQSLLGQHIRFYYYLLSFTPDTFPLVKLHAFLIFSRMPARMRNRLACCVARGAATTRSARKSAPRRGYFDTPSSRAERQACADVSADEAHDAQILRAERASRWCYFVKRADAREEMQRFMP